jgi:hypothetical protein
MPKSNIIKEPVTFAFIDSQNLNLGVRELGWKLEYLPKKKSPREDKNSKGKSPIGDKPTLSKKGNGVNRNNSGRKLKSNEK